VSHAFALVGVLIAIGAIPVLPALFGLVKNHSHRGIRAAARAAATLCLFLCFIESFGGVLVTAIKGVLPFGEVPMLVCTAAFVITACIFSWNAARPDKP